MNELESLHKAIDNKLKENNHLDNFFKSIHNKLLNGSENDNITLNMGGKRYSISKSVLVSINDTLFYFYFEIYSNNTELFFDRDGRYFGDIIDYYNYRCLPLVSFSEERLKILQADANYYEILPLIKYIDYYLTPIKLKKIMTKSTVYDGENDINITFTSKETNTGALCDQYDYTIVFKLNMECEFNSIDIKGYSGEIRNNWNINNGHSSFVFSSMDNENWTKVGQLPNNILTIQTIPLLKSKAKYIKFSHDSKIGFSYLKLNKYL